MRDPGEDLPTLGPAAGDEVIVVPWSLLFRQRVATRLEGSERYRWWVLWTVLAGLFSVNFTFTVFAVALPRIARELGTTENTLTWVITGPMLAFGVAAPALGRAGDVWGHRRVYLLGMAGAVVGAALSAAAWSAGSLIAFRTVNALEGAATGAASMALIFRVFHPRDRVKAMGWWSLVGAGGPVIGVAVGGLVIQAVGWRWIFVAQVPITLAALLLAAAVLPETDRIREVKFDAAGAMLLAGAVTSFLFAINRGPEWGWSSVGVIAAFVAAPALAVAFVVVERRADDPLLPIEYLRRRNFAFPIGAQALANFAYMGGFILAPSLLTHFFGYDEARIGLIVLTRPLAFSIMAPIAGYVAVRVGERISAVVGSLAVVGSMVLFAGVSGNSTDALVIGALVLSGVGLGISSPSIAASVANSVDEASLGIASAAQQLMTQVGVVTGIQLMRTVQTTVSYRAAYLLGGVVAVGAVVCGAFVQNAARDERVVAIR
ncbi:MAG: MFS transporter [Actinobacteria bacterium]|nr:MFS transporter [Actinomycetota bacterium]